MLTFLTRRIVVSVLVLLAASFLVYMLAANSGDPLSALRTSTSPNKAAELHQRSLQLHLNIPAPVRYFYWLWGVIQGIGGHLDLGTSVTGQPVTSMLSSAVGVTVQLLTASFILAIIFGVLIGITSALRQYSGYDYSVTFLAFLFFSLPSFFVAVILKAYVGIAFNNFLQDPTIATWLLIGLPLLSGLIWQGILGGDARKRLLTFAIAAVVTFGVLFYISATHWLNNPSLGLPVILVLGLGLGLLVVVLTTGIENRKSLYTAVVVVAIGALAYFGFDAISRSLNVWSVLGLGVVAIGVGVLVGYLFAGPDRWLSARTGGITALLVGGLIVVDRFMQDWQLYATQVVSGRPIATVGAATPNLSDVTHSFWIQGLDSFTHLLLPTLSLMLISLAGYSRYSRANLLDVLNQDYIRTARAKGLNERTVIMRHAFRNALIPLTTVIAFDIGALVGGAIITETVFAWSGMGVLFNNALQQTDVNALMGYFIVTGVIIVIFNIVADLLYSVLDPRIRVAV
ncbi:MAG: glutathione transport system permease protein [Actinomycetota bacterium]|jgi:peptide/nickel transport system permease protein|nr:glutathione transport system permease protein [Actinomycetota bacterium]